MSRFVGIVVLVTILVAGLVQPAAAAPCPWGTNCITVNLVAPASGATLRGTVPLEATARQDQPAQRGNIVKVEWWLYHPSFQQQVPENEEGKILLFESTTPASGTRLNGTWRGSWTVARSMTTRDGAYQLPGTRTYTLPDAPGYSIEAHVLDEEWERTWGGPPGRSSSTPVTIDFGSDPPPPPPPPPSGDVNIGGLTMPTSVEVLPNGRVYISEKGGAIKTAPNLSSSTATTVRTLSTYTNGDHGLQSLAYHPNGYLYAAYTRQPTGYCDPADYGQDGRGCVVHGQVSRFLVDSDGTLGTEQQIRGGPGSWCAQFTTHGIDDLEVGPDGNLYVSAGDGAGFTGADTGQYDGDPCGGGGALRAQSAAHLSGNVVRMNPTTGATTTVAYGLRNPYRISFQPGTDTLFVGDVGWYNAEEINRFSVTGPVPNFGWPCREGTGPMSFYADLSACAGVTGTPPLFSYPHGGSNAAVSAVGFHGGRLYYGDYHRQFIRSIAPDGTGDRSEATGVMPVDITSTSSGLIYADIGRGAVRTVAGTGEPPPSPPFAEVIVGEAPWEPGDTIEYAVDYRNFGRQPVQVNWTVRDGDGRVVHTQTASPAGPDGTHRGTMVAPQATHPASLTFTAVVTNADGARVETSQTRQMAEPSARPPSGTNLMPNPSLEQASGGVPTCYMEGGWGSAGTWSRVSDAHTGSFAHQVTISSHSSGDRKLMPQFTTGCAPQVQAGGAYDLSVHYRSTSPNVAFVGFARNASTGTWDYWFTSPSQPTSSGWREASATTPPVPSNVDRISWGLALYGSGTLTTDTYAMVPTGSQPPPPPPPPPPPASNLVTNPSLEQATGSVPTCWLQGGWGTNNRAWSRVSTAQSGSFAHRVTMTSFTDGDAKLLQDFTSACAPTVTPGQTYVLSAYYTSSVPTPFIGFVRNGATGAWSYWFTSATQPASSTYRQATMTTPPVPAGADRISWGLGLVAAGSLTTDTYAMSTTATSGSGGIEMLREQPPSVGLATSSTAAADGPPPPMPPPDVDPPRLDVVRGPAAGAKVSGIVDLQLDVGDRMMVDVVTIHAGRGRSGRLAELAPGQDVTQFDTRQLKNGRHQLSIVASDINGNETTVTRDIIVDNKGRRGAAGR